MRKFAVDVTAAAAEKALSKAIDEALNNDESDATEFDKKMIKLLAPAAVSVLIALPRMADSFERIADALEKQDKQDGALFPIPDMRDV